MPLLCGRSVAAEHHHFKTRVIIKNVRDAQAIGDNAQMIMVEQRARHLLNRRSNRDKYRGAIRNIVSHGFRNGFFSCVRETSRCSKAVLTTLDALPAPP